MHQIETLSSAEMAEYLVDSIRVAKKGKMTKPSLMSDANPELIQKKPFVFMAAAISDYIPSFPQHGKIKKSDIGEKWSLALKENQDILSSITSDDICTIGFKAEMDAEVGLANAKAMLDKKSLNAVCYNHLEGSESFGTDENAIEFITPSKRTSLPKQDKLNLSFSLIELCKTL
jgi:phosphopantothenoylcysteine decarboxylase/phosphopantothenate--cysteine ligase